MEVKPFSTFEMSLAVFKFLWEISSEDPEKISPLTKKKKINDLNVIF